MNIKLFFISLVSSLSLLFSVTNISLANTVTSEVHLIDEHGIGKSIGTITFTDSAKGLEIRTNLHNLPQGEHGFHIHELNSCEPGEHEGHLASGMQAHGHYDPEKTGKHRGPLGDGHKGDLPVLFVKSDGTAKEVLIAPRLKVDEIKGHSIMIHSGGDNYLDKPLPLGGGGDRIACGSIPN